MNLDKISVILIISIVAFSGIISSEVSSGAQTWVLEDPNATAFRLSDLTATITVTVKNTNDHIQYFKISQAYQPEGLTDKVNWTIDWDHTNPTPVRMVKSIQANGDYGWPIKAGETKTVCFKLNAHGLFGGTPSYFKNLDSTEQTYWPLINEPGLIGTWFAPNELEVLNPTLDIRKWKGTFTFRVNNVISQKAYGIVRAPIVPINSKLTSSNPNAFIDDETMVNTDVAAWNVVLLPGDHQDYSYTYVWPSTSSSSSTAHAGSQTLTTSSGSSNPSVPSKQTGVPYGLFIVGTLVTVAGVAYARLMR